MEQYTSEDARRELRRILNAVENGGQVEITRYGKPLAVISPVGANTPMKLFIWEDVLRDYSAGMIVALAPDLESALAAVRDDSYVRAAMGEAKPEVIEIGPNTQAQTWYVHGGG